MHQWNQHWDYGEIYMALSGEDYMAKEIYAREAENLRATIPNDKQDERTKIIIEWLEARVRELQEKTQKKTVD